MSPACASRFTAGTVPICSGGWTACAVLVDGEKWAESTNRSVREICAKNFVFDLRLIAEVREEITRSHEMFRRHRIIGGNG